MIPIYDVLTQWVVPAVTITGRTDKVKIATFNGTPFAIGLVQEGKVEVDIGENLDWIGHAVVDCRDAHALRPADREGSEDPAADLRQEQRRHGRQAAAGQHRLWRRLYRGIRASCGSCTKSRERGGIGYAAQADLRFFASSGLSKSFGGARALDDVSSHGAPRRSARPARAERLRQIHADQDPVGLSRAGRTADDRDRWRARSLCRSALSSLRAHGVSFVHQHLGLMPSLTVLENLLLPDFAAEARWFIDWRAEAKRARELFARYDIGARSAAIALRVWRRSSARNSRSSGRSTNCGREKRQSGARGLLVLDEPTPFLPAHDVASLFRLIREIVADGASVIFVSHDIDEVLEITDRATVLRDGRVAGVVRDRGDVESRGHPAYRRRSMSISKRCGRRRRRLARLPSSYRS